MGGTLDQDSISNNIGTPWTRTTASGRARNPQTGGSGISSGGLATYSMACIVPNSSSVIPQHKLHCIPRPPTLEVPFKPSQRRVGSERRHRILEEPDLVNTDQAQWGIRCLENHREEF